MRTRRRFNPGDRIGGWTLLEYPYKSRKVLVRCDCGFEAWRWLSNFSAGTSQGCRECMKSDPAEKTFKHTQRTAARRGIEWKLTLAQWENFAQQPCYYCGDEPSNMISLFGYAYNGIDRIDSNGVYEVDNCVPSCRICNRAKSDRTTQQFYEWVERVHGKIASLS